MGRHCHDGKKGKDEIGKNSYLTILWLDYSEFCSKNQGLGDMVCLNFSKNLKKHLDKSNCML